MSTAFQPMTSPPPTFREARDLLLELHDNYCDAKTAFVWPRPERFNWALDWFDAELAAGEAGARPALKVLGKTVETKSFAELSEASSRLASGLRALGAKRGDRLLMMLGTTPELWVTMLASMKLGLVLIPAMPTLGPDDIADRLDARPGEIHRRPCRRRGEIRRPRRRRRAHRRRRDAGGMARFQGGDESGRVSSRTGRRSPTIRCCSTSPRARRRGRSSSCTPMRAIRSAICRRCTASASGPATRISTFPRPAGRSTPGRASSRPGTLAPQCSPSPNASSRARRSTILVAHGVTAFCAPPTVWRMLIQ